jgi:uncharacterized protein (TIGR02444 family)
VSANLAQPDSYDSGPDALEYDNDFWRFSLAVYGQIEVAKECLDLQQTIGIDVNILLFCAWIGRRNFALGHKEIEAASRIVAAWHENVVRPLRSVRQQVKTLHRHDFESFRTRVKDIEIEAEQIEQATLFAHSKRLRAGLDCGDAVAQNVNDYIAMKSGGGSVRASELTAPRLIDAARRLRS